MFEIESNSGQKGTKPDQMPQNHALSEIANNLEINHLEPMDCQTEKTAISGRSGTENKALATGKTKPKRVKGNGAARFRKACERVLRRESEKIAETLVEQACAGDLSSARLLVKVIETLRQRRKKTT